jgi:hypothetical protein
VTELVNLMTVIKGGVNQLGLDDGICDAVVLLNTNGFRTFTSCEGGRGHSFQHATIGLQLERDYPTFQGKLVEFLRSQGMQNFTISLVTDFHPDYPEGKRCVYLEGLDLLSEDKRKQVIESSKRRERRLRRELGAEETE